jgi:hypothetical protein
MVIKDELDDRCHVQVYVGAVSPGDVLYLPVCAVVVEKSMNADSVAIRATCSMVLVVGAWLEAHIEF